MSRDPIPTGAWVVRTWWLALPGEGALDDRFTTVDGNHPEREPARKQALSLACCRGAVAVVLYDPDGEIAGHWDRFSNIAHHLSSAEPAPAIEGGQR